MKSRACVLFSLEIADLASENNASDGGAVCIRADVPRDDRRWTREIRPSEPGAKIDIA
jgi:hypothetical protein